MAFGLPLPGRRRKVSANLWFSQPGGRPLRFAALTAKPEMVFESGRVKIKAPIAANANLGPYAIEVNAVTPMHMSGTLKPSTVSGTLEMGRRKYK